MWWLGAIQICGLQGGREFRAWNSWWITYTTVLPFMFLRVILLFMVTLALRKLALTDNSGSRSCSLPVKQVQHFRRWEEALGPMLIPFLASPEISSSLLSTVMHLWHFVICEKNPLCCSHEARLPPGNPELVEGPGAQAQSHGEGVLRNSPKLLVGGRAWGRTICNSW